MFAVGAGLLGAPASAANRFATQLRSRPAGEQARILVTVIRSAGERCASARSLVEIGEAGGTFSWRVDCGTGRFLVGVAADASTRVVDCAILRRAGRRTCP